MTTNLYSTYPEEIRVLNHPMGDFRIKACEPGQDYSVTVIQDKDENVSGGSLEGVQLPSKILTTKSEEIAKWLAEIPADGGGFGGRGVFTALGAVPTPAEILAARERMNAFFKAQFDMASDSWEKTRTRRAINDIARLAAKHMNVTPEWLSADAAASMKTKCPACKTLIDKDAFTCSQCKFDVNPTGLAALRAQYATQPPPVKQAAAR